MIILVLYVGCLYKYVEECVFANKNKDLNVSPPPCCHLRTLHLLKMSKKFHVFLCYTALFILPMVVKGKGVCLSEVPFSANDSLYVNFFFETRG